MAVVVSSYGALTAMASPALPIWSGVSQSGPFYDGARRSYVEIYRRQPAVRTVVDFFARNIAQLGLHLYQRVSDTDRVRLGRRDHVLPAVIARPNPRTTRYRMVESTVQDIGIFANGYWLKVRVRDRLGLVRLPGGELKVAGTILPTGYTWAPAAAPAREFAPSEIVHFRLYDPGNPSLGFPPIETLRRVLAEEAAAGDYRQHFWTNAARVETVLTRPKDAAKWQPEQREEFRRQWQEFAGRKAGMTPVLEDGMEVKVIGQSFRDSEYLGARKLSREEVAAAYHVPLPMVGILEHATFSNIREQHKQLYQDCLGPWLVMLEEELELQLLPEFDDGAGVDVEDLYLEFNIQEKLKGSFDEQVTSLSTAIGRPFMTVNEGRARLNMPRDPAAASDQIAEVAQGQAAPRDRRNTDDADRTAAAAAFRAVLVQFSARQRARLEKDPPAARAATFNHARWSRELAADLRAACGDVTSWGQDVDRIASLINSETWELLKDGQAPWPAARIDALVTRFAEEVARG